MLDEYKKIYPIVYKQFKNALNGKLAHAYLFDLNDNIYAESMILSFVKSILCKEHNSIDEYKECDKCSRIDNDNYPELIKIKADGQFIKKEQLDYLQKKFSTKPIESDYKIYIIYDVEKLNSASANSLLKFLEEPPEGVIAILLTNHINYVIKTIVSRCQIINFDNNKVEDFIKLNNISKDITLHKLAFLLFKIKKSDEITDEHKFLIESGLKFIEFYEKNGLKTIIHEKNYVLDIFNTKDKLLNLFDILIVFYRDVINYKLSKAVLYYDDNIELLKFVSNKNDINKLLSKINVLINKQKLLFNNINTNMLIDSLIIDMEE